jgi:hypothetical protein
VGEVGGAVERIDNPSMLACRIGTPVAFLRKDGVIGEGALQYIDHRGFGFMIGFGNEINRITLAADAGMAEAFEMNPASGTRRADSHSFHCLYRIHLQRFSVCHPGEPQP